MKTKFFARSLIAATMAGSISCAMAQTSDSTTATAAPAAQSAYGTMAEQQLQSYLKGLQTAFPSSRFTLKTFQNTGNQSTAVIESYFDFGVDMWTDDKVNMTFETDLTIHHNPVLENGRFDVAQIEWTTRATENTTFELLDLLGDQPIEQGKGTIALNGDITGAIQSARALEGEADDIAFNVPSYTGTFRTYNQGQLADMDVTMPSLAAYSTDPYYEGSGLWITNLRILQSGKPIRDHQWQFNGHNEVSVEKAEFRDEGETVFTLNNGKYTEDSKVDDEGLLQTQFTFAGNAVVDVENPTEKPVQVDSFDVAGTISNLHVDNYLKLMDQFKDDFYGMDSKAMENIMLDILSHGPKVDISKFSLVLNGDKGELSYDIGIQPFTAEERQTRMHLLIMQKLQAHASMDIPVSWLNIFMEDYEIEDFLDETVARGYITRTGDRITSNFSYEMGNMTVNGKPLNMGRGFPF